MNIIYVKILSITKFVGLFRRLIIFVASIDKIEAVFCQFFLAYRSQN